jgi:pSer/pThr/pTyr-binding forkhead associated (FHA) protein
MAVELKYKEDTPIRINPRRRIVTVGANKESEVNLSQCLGISLCGLGVSRRHMAIHQSPGNPNEVYVEDLESTHGTYVNEQRVNRKTLLTHKSQLSLGKKGATFTISIREKPKPISLVGEKVSEGISGIISSLRDIEDTEVDFTQTSYNGVYLLDCNDRYRKIDVPLLDIITFGREKNDSCMNYAMLKLNGTDKSFVSALHGAFERFKSKVTLTDLSNDGRTVHLNGRLIKKGKRYSLKDDDEILLNETYKLLFRYNE